MELLEARIRRDGLVYEGDILKVDNFLNHQMDVPFLSRLADEFARRFANDGVTKVLTIEASGIGIATLTALHLRTPLLFAKKSRSSNLAPDVYSAEVVSYTHGNTNNVLVSTRFLRKEDRVLIVDDFLATGAALKGLISLVAQAGATLVGCGIVIEKAYQPGGSELRAQGIRIESLARVKSMAPPNCFEFIED